MENENAEPKKVVPFLPALIVIVLVAGGVIFALKSNQEEAGTKTETPTTSPMPAQDAPGTDEMIDNHMMEGGEMMQGDKMMEGTMMAKEITVTYDGTTFSPATIEIKKGDEVHFVNTSGKEMWVASNDHPTHTIYPEFDAKKTVGTDGVYEFVFSKVGSWKYHDHKNSRAGGTVIVK